MAATTLFNTIGLAGLQKCRFPWNSTIKYNITVTYIVKVEKPKR